MQTFKILLFISLAFFGNLICFANSAILLQEEAQSDEVCVECKRVNLFARLVIDIVQEINPGSLMDVANVEILETMYFVTKAAEGTSSSECNVITNPSFFDQSDNRDVIPIERLRLELSSEENISPEQLSRLGLPSLLKITPKSDSDLIASSYHKIRFPDGEDGYLHVAVVNGVPVLKYYRIKGALRRVRLSLAGRSADELARAQITADSETQTSGPQEEQLQQVGSRAIQTGGMFADEIEQFRSQSGIDQPLEGTNTDRVQQRTQADTLTSRYDQQGPTMFGGDQDLSLEVDEVRELNGLGFAASGRADLSSRPDQTGIESLQLAGARLIQGDNNAVAIQGATSLVGEQGGEQFSLQAEQAVGDHTLIEGNIARGENDRLDVRATTGYDTGAVSYQATGDISRDELEDSHSLDIRRVSARSDFRYEQRTTQQNEGESQRSERLSASFDVATGVRVSGESQSEEGSRSDSTQVEVNVGASSLDVRNSRSQIDGQGSTKTSDIRYRQQLESGSVALAVSSGDQTQRRSLRIDRGAGSVAHLRAQDEYGDELQQTQLRVAGVDISHDRFKSEQGQTSAQRTRIGIESGSLTHETVDDGREKITHTGYLREGYQAPQPSRVDPLVGRLTDSAALQWGGEENSPITRARIDALSFTETESEFFSQNSKVLDIHVSTPLGASTTARVDYRGASSSSPDGSERTDSGGLELQRRLGGEDGAGSTVTLTGRRDQQGNGSGSITYSQDGSNQGFDENGSPASYSGGLSYDEANDEVGGYVTWRNNIGGLNLELDASHYDRDTGSETNYRAVASTANGFSAGVGRENGASQAFVGASSSGRVRGTDSSYNASVLLMYQDDGDQASINQGSSNNGGPATGEGISLMFRGEILFGRAPRARVRGSEIGSVASIRDSVRRIYEQSR